MKFVATTLLAAIALPLASAFAPVARPTFATATQLSLVTGAKGKPAASPEEDLKLLSEVIMSHIGQEESSEDGDAPAPAPAPVVAKEKKVVVEVDVSIPYDAAAQLAYDASDKSMDFKDFNSQYLADAVALVISKRPVAPAPAPAPVAAKEKKVAVEVDVNIPYNAAAKLAYDASDKSVVFGAFETQYLADAVAMATAKKEAKEKS